jgi:hypothetical protein
MRSYRRKAAVLGAIAVLFALGWGPIPGTATLSGAAGRPSAGEIVLIYGVGGVLTSDGTLWQFRPDTGAWVTVDAAFEKEGRTTHVLPLPVPVAEIAEMESFGFILTRAGGCWLYDLEKDSWREIGPPPRRP